MSTKLTDPKVFEGRLLCTRCGLDLADFDENTPAGDCKHRDFSREDTRRFLPDYTSVKDIHLRRIPGTEGQCGNAIADIAQRFVYHSPTGFEWGYGGSGPSDLALNVLALFVPPAEAWRLHHDYKRDVIAALPHEGGTITAESVRDWIKMRWGHEWMRNP